MWGIIWHISRNIKNWANKLYKIKKSFVASLNHEISLRGLTNIN
jgi:hypothetical protein